MAWQGRGHLSDETGAGAVTIRTRSGNRLQHLFEKQIPPFTKPAGKASEPNGNNGSCKVKPGRPNDKKSFAACEAQVSIRVSGPTRRKWASCDDHLQQEQPR